MSCLSDGHCFRLLLAEVGLTLTWMGIIYERRCANLKKKNTDFTLGRVWNQFKRRLLRGAWMAQSVEHPTSAQVMISQFVGLSPTSGSVLTAQSLEPASDSVSPSLSVPPLPVLSVSLKNK